MAMRQMAGPVAEKPTCAGASFTNMRVTVRMAVTWNFIVTDDKIGQNRK
jgi:hypothetical protein